MRDILFRLIVYSDNRASTILVKNIPIGILTSVYTDIGVPNPAQPDSSETEFLSVKDYTSFFRVLYNASYVEKNI